MTKQEFDVQADALEQVSKEAQILALKATLEYLQLCYDNFRYAGYTLLDRDKLVTEIESVKTRLNELQNG